MSSSPPPDDRTGSSVEAAFAALAAVELNSEPLYATLQRIIGATRSTIPGLAEVSVTVIENDHASTVVSTGSLAAQLDERQYEIGYGPCLDAASSGQTISLHVSDSEPLYPDFARSAQAAGIQHVVSVSLPLAQPVAGALNMYVSASSSLTDAEVELGQSFAGYAAAAVTATPLLAATIPDLSGRLRAAVTTRALIERAKGVVMVREGCSAAEAFTLMVRTAHEQNGTLREAAEAILATTARDRLGAPDPG